MHEPNLIILTVFLFDCGPFSDFVLGAMRDLLVQAARNDVGTPRARRRLAIFKNYAEVVGCSHAAESIIATGDTPRS